MNRRHSKIQWSSLMGEEELEFNLRFQCSLHKRMDHGLLLDEFLKRLQTIKEEGKRIVTIEMEVDSIERKNSEEVVYDFSIHTFFEGSCTQEWVLQKIEAALQSSLVPFNWMKLTA
ncbi:hypothetical protein [Paenibacillus sp. Y412MC10]|uniref:hypothetical protein n=1 Tax=Geobacillus sp. (strain Y412MC10) TaxID=481743 RepID=UPI0011AB8756|nr:hypothetical protein [Paenibacillus sp. Y412MC10]